MLMSIVTGLFIFSMFYSGETRAEEYSVSGGVKQYLFDEVDEEIGGFVKVNIKGLLDEYIVLSGGFEFVSTESVGGKDIDIYRLPLEVGYVIPLGEKFSLTPVVGFDPIFGEDEAVGTHVGVNLIIAEPFGVVGLNGTFGVEYLFAEIDIDEVETNLDGFILAAGISYRF